MAAQSFSATKMHAFASNPLTSASASAPDGASFISVDSALASIRSLLKSNVNKEAVEKRDDAVISRILPVKRGKPLVVSVSADCKDEEAAPAWRLAWQSPARCGKVLETLGEEILVFLGHSSSGVSHWALDVSNVPSDHLDLEEKEDSDEQQETRSDFVELRTLMVAADWSDVRAMSDLSIAGHARALLEWNALSQFCSRCGTKMIPIEGGRRRQCQNSDCKRRYYPRVDPVVIMLVIDKENDRALLSRQSRFVPRMWSCLAGFIEPGESLEEAVRRETLEEVGIEVGEVTYHSSQPWPVGPSSMPCQLMVGFFAAAKSLDICVDKKELEDAQWHSREDVKKALSFAEYKKAQRTSAFRVHQICGGIEKGQGLASDFNIETGELAPMFVPGPFAIAHHLISSWARQGADVMTS